MRNFKILILAFVAILLINSANAATIYGAIYDLSLKKLNNARVEINTVPNQFLIAQNGSYSFNVPNGAYTIKAQLMQKNTVIASVQENITISQDGSYVLDLILFPDIDEGVESIDIDVSGNIVENKNKNYPYLALFFIVLTFGLLSWFYYHRKNKKQKTNEDKDKKEKRYEDGSLEQLISIIRQEGSRMTQKEIRKQIPLSEAKISLMIAELEHKGIVEKIKKGRGNIIILKRNE